MPDGPFHTLNLEDTDVDVYITVTAAGKTTGLSVARTNDKTPPEVDSALRLRNGPLFCR